MDIREDEVSGPEIVALLKAHLADMARHSPPENGHALDLDDLRRPDVTMFSASEVGALLGCGALKELDPRHGEIKSMRAAEAHLRRGVGARILVRLIDEARRRGYRRLSLETGSTDFYVPARALYLRFRLRGMPALRRLPIRRSQRLHDPDALIAPGMQADVTQHRRQFFLSCQGDLPFFFRPQIAGRKWRRAERRFGVLPVPRLSVTPDSIRRPEPTRKACARFTGPRLNSGGDNVTYPRRDTLRRSASWIQTNLLHRIVFFFSHRPLAPCIAATDRLKSSPT